MGYPGFVATIELGERGHSGSKNPNRLPAGSLVKSRNIQFVEGSVTKERGTDQFTSASLGGAARIVGLFDYTPSPGVRRAVAATASGNLVYDSSDDGTFATTLKTGRNAASRNWFTEGGIESNGRSKKLFVANGVNTVLVISADAVSTGNLSAPPSDWSGTNQPIQLFMHRNRMHGIGNPNDPSRDYYTPAGDHENFSGGGSNSIYPGEGGGLRAGVSAFGLAIYFKDYGIYYLNDADASAANWTIDRIPSQYGTFGPHTVAQIADDTFNFKGVAYIGRDAGIYLLTPTDRFGSLSVTELTALDEMKNTIRDNINVARLAHSSLTYYPEKRELHAVYVPSGQTEASYRVVADFNGSTPKFRVSDRDTIVSMTLMRDSNSIQRPAFGNAYGQIYMMDQDGLTNDGSGYASEFQTSHTDFSFVKAKVDLGPRRKIFDWMEAQGEPLGSWNTTVTAYLDGEAKYSFDLFNGYVSHLDSFVLDEDVLVGDLGQGRVFPARHRLFGAARTLSLHFANSGNAQGFSYSKILVGFRLGDERISE